MNYIYVPNTQEK